MSTSGQTIELLEEKIVLLEAQLLEVRQRFLKADAKCYFVLDELKKLRKRLS